MKRKLLIMFLGLTFYNWSFSQYCSTTNDGSACINNVTFNSIDNTTPGCEGTDNYNEQSATTMLGQGVTYTFSLTTSEDAITSVWIDWDQDDEFEEDEWWQVYTSASTGSIDIDVPLSATLGTTGMRVRSRLTGNQNGAADACGYMGSGETEDYVVTIGPPPSCPQPVSPHVVSTTTSNATIAWTPGGSETQWQVKYGAPGFASSGGTALIVNVDPTVTPYVIGGLTTNTFYQFYVRAICGPGDTSFYSGPRSFNTFGLGQFIEAGTECGDGFTDISGTGTDLGLEDDLSDGVTLPFSFYYQGTLVNDITIGNNGGILLNTLTGDVNYGMEGPGIYPYTQDLNTANAGGGVYYQTLGTAPNRKFIVQWTDLTHYDFPAAEDGATFQFVLEEATMEFYFLYNDVMMGNEDWDNGGAAEIGIRGTQDIDVSLYDQAYLTDHQCAHFYYTDCPKPQNISFTDLSNDEFGVEWEAGLGGETEWTLEYGTTGFTPGTGTYLSGITTPAQTISGLNQLTEYDVYIYAQCAVNDSSSAATGNVLTLPECANPYAIYGETEAEDSIFMTWEWTQTLEVLDHFNIQYGNENFTLGSGTTYASEDDYEDTVADVNLMAGVTYDVYVQAACQSGEVSSFIGPFTIVMPLTNDTVCYAEMLNVDGTVYHFVDYGATADNDTPSNQEQSIAPPATGYQEIDGWAESTISSSTWFKFVAPASGSMRVSCTDVEFDGQVAVYEVGNCAQYSTFELMGANDDEIGGSSTSPNFTVCGLTPGNTYYLMYDPAFDWDQGEYSIKLTQIVLQAGSTGSLLETCSGDTVNLFDGITGNDDGGAWIPVIPSIALAQDSLFASGGLAYQIFDFQYRMTDGCAYDSIIANVKVFAPSHAGNDGSLLVCRNQPFNLLPGLSGNVDFGGTWYDPNSVTIPSGNATSSNIPGQYNYRYITGNGVCPNDTAKVLVNVQGCNYLGLEETAFEGFSLYPNPTEGSVFISNVGSTEVFSYEVLDLNGRKVIVKEDAINGKTVTEIDLKSMQTGVYMIHVFNESAGKTFRVVVK